MPRVTITNNTKEANSTLPNGVKLEITVGNAPPVTVGVGLAQSFNVGRNEVIRIKPTNKMMQQVNYIQPDGNDRALSIIPADRDAAFGVRIA
jgi:hypothetical protein